MNSETCNKLLALPVHLHFCHGKFFLWKPDDISKIRNDLRIVGCAVGSYPPKPRQNVQLSLPIQLTNVEAKFLVEHINCEMVNQDCLSLLHNTPEDVSEKRKQQLEIQSHIKGKEKLNLMDSMESIIKQGKAKKNNNKLANVMSKQFDKTLDVDTNFEEFKQYELQKVQHSQNNLLWIKTEQEGTVHKTYPFSGDKIHLTPEESLQFCVFKDLNLKGYFLTDGVKFGGDFLVYPGDPGIYHSMFIALCVASSRELSAAEYAAMGRLASSVRKTLLICSVDKNDCVSYLSIAWSGLA